MRLMVVEELLPIAHGIKRQGLMGLLLVLQRTVVQLHFQRIQLLRQSHQLR